jgi:hypothetical protein
MHLPLAAAAVALLSASAVLAQDSTSIVCHTAPCVVTFEWGNSGSVPPDPDRRYGAPSELESSFVSGLQQAGLQVSRSGAAPTVLLVRITPQNRALCDAAVGTNPDYSCHTAQRAAITIQRSDSVKGGVTRVDINPRCTDPKSLPSFTQFGQFAADYFIYMASGQKGHRPTSIKC